MGIREKLSADVKTAMKDRSQVKLDSLRFLQSAIKNREIELRPNPISDDEVLTVVKKLVKQRRESIEQYKAGGRMDLVEKESLELGYLEEYLPQMLAREEVEKIVHQVVTDLNAKSVREMGSVMKEVLARAAGRADSKVISDLVKSKLQ